MSDFDLKNLDDLDYFEESGEDEKAKEITKTVKTDWLDRNGETIYGVGAIITGVIVFFGIWIYSFASWGFLIGLMIGWLPAIIGAFIAGVLWPLILLVGLPLLVLLFMP